MAKRSLQLAAMRTGRRLTLGVALAGAMLAPQAAGGFTVEDGSPDPWTPKFNLEEQARQFSTPGGGDTATGGIKKFDTPIGSLHFGVGRDASGFGSPFSRSFDSTARAQDDRRHLNRMFTPIQRPNDGL